MNNKRALIKEKWMKKYRLVVLSDDSFEDQFSFKLTRLNLFVTVGALGLILIVITILLIAATSLKEYIPGFASPELKKNAVSLNVKLDSLQKNINALENYIESLKPALVGEKVIDLAELPYVNKKGGFDVYQKGIKNNKENNSTRIKELEVMLRDKNEQIAKLSKELSQIGKENSSHEAEREKILEKVDERLFKRSKKDSMFRALVEKEQQFSLFGNQKNISNHLFTSPIHGKIIRIAQLPTSVYISVAKNQTIKSIGNGVVVFATYTFQNGYVAIIAHQKKYLSIYKNLEKLTVKQGQLIKGGQAIGVVNSNELRHLKPYLQFELWKDGFAVNPKNIIQF